MKKFITPTYTFTPGASGVGTVDLSGIANFDVKNLVSIINQTNGVVIYATGSQSLKYTNVTGTTVTLFADTSTMSAGDTLQVIYEDNTAQPIQPILVDRYGNETPQLATLSGGTAIGNSVHRFRDGFVLAAPDLDTWDQQWIDQGSSFVAKGGEANGSGFLKISMCPYTLNSEYILTSKETFKFPVVLGFGYSASQRVLGTEFEFGIAGTDENGNIEYITAKPDVALPATISVSSNAATIVFATNHSFKGLDRVVIHGNSDNRINVGPVIVTVVDQFTISVPMVTGNGTYNCNGFIRYADPLGDVSNSAGLVIGDNTTVTQMQLYSRRNGSSYRVANVATATSVATTSGTSNFTETFNAANNIELLPSPDDIVAVSRTADSTSSPSTPVRFSQGIPDETKEYKIFIRAKNNARLPRPVAKIVSATKSGTTTATITTDVPHGLTTTSRITIYGIRDIANFPNLSSTVNPSSIISPTQFTVVIGTTTTGSSAGGRVDSCEANTVITGGNFPNVQSISRTNDLMNIVFNTTISGLVQGETIHLYGCDATSMGLYDGAYLVRRIVGSIVVVDSVGPNFTSINCGGSILKRTDFRLHSVRLNDYLRTTVEVTSNGSGDASKGIPVTGTVGVSSVGGTVTTTVSSGYLDGFTSPPLFNLGAGSYLEGISSTISTFSEHDIVQVSQYFSQNCTSGTTYTNDYYTTFAGYIKHEIDITAFIGSGRIKLTLEESIDGSYSFRPIYSTQSVTGNGLVYVPSMPLKGSIFRWKIDVPTGVSATVTAFFSRAPAGNINAVQQTLIAGDINLNTLFSSGPALGCEDVEDFYLSVNTGTQSTAATVVLQFSMNGINWHTPSTSLNTVANSVVYTKYQNEGWNYVRAAVITAGTSVVLNELIVRGVK